MNVIYRALLGFVCILIFAPGVHAKDKPPVITVGGVQVAVWLPKDDSPRPWPVVIFSHGFHGCDTQSVFLMEALANAGYAVFAPNHKDATCDGGDSHWLSLPEKGFGRAYRWDDGVYTDRRDDIKTLLYLLPQDERFAHNIDWGRVGLAGHSLGGYTVLGLAGGWPSWRDSRVKAVLALSPYCAPFASKHTLGGIGVPVMYQGGTRDRGITPGVKKEGGAYDETSAPKYFVEIDGATHFAFADIRDTHHDVISAYGVAFLDTYLKGKPFPQELMSKGEGVSDLRIDAGGGGNSSKLPWKR